jgi:chaperonin cofactor prefoldin
MDSGTVISILSLIGTLSGSFGGILVSSKLTNYRIEQLEKKVDRHNSFAERMPVMEEQIKVINHRLEDLEHEMQRPVG